MSHTAGKHISSARNWTKAYPCWTQFYDAEVQGKDTPPGKTRYAEYIFDRMQRINGSSNGKIPTQLIPN
jgi:hypothetical protein